MILFCLFSTLFKMKQIKKIVIVGGGTAGWSTAHHFLNNTHPDTEIIVVATKEVPIIGVGESTTGRFKDLINNENLRLLVFIIFKS